MEKLESWAMTPCPFQLVKPVKPDRYYRSGKCVL